MLSFKRFFSFSKQILARHKVFPPLNIIGNRAFVESIAESQDGTAFFAWHPKKEVPYEFTRPLPVALESNNNSLLREQAVEAAKVAWKLKRPEFSREELSKLTFTTVHRWYPRSRDKKAKKTPMDRRYL